MNVYKSNDISTLLKNNEYAGRGIIIGTSPDGKSAVCAYFIMGRSENSRNRVFVRDGETLKTEPFDASKVSDPSLIIYNAVRKSENNLIVTNGDQTDTIYDFIKDGKDFKAALETRSFEPDEPNFTPRISSMLTFANGSFTYEMSILKSIDKQGSGCARYTFSYPAKKGLGHFLHTYVTDGEPLPTFQGEPERVRIPDDIESLTTDIWEHLDANNKISLYVRYTDLATGKEKYRLINRFA